ncbi:unnamed protein product [Urochloa decumbens]|uniref:CASP-like protein n=1 Tax=Urochloa decumbens TaxID=240449 RepID=A0ABC9FRB2_9POAL
MRNIPGSPGRWSGLVLRVAQFLFAGAALVSLEMIDGFASSKSGINCLILSMDLIMVWSFVLLCVDGYALKMQIDLHHLRAVRKIFVGDWFVGIFSSGVASSNLGVFLFFHNDIHSCTREMKHQCDLYRLSILLAFISWSFLAASAGSIFWLLAELSNL